MQIPLESAIFPSLLKCFDGNNPKPTSKRFSLRIDELLPELYKYTDEEAESTNPVKRYISTKHKPVATPTQHGYDNDFRKPPCKCKYLKLKGKENRCE